MPIQVTCDCGKSMNVPDKLAGKTIRCKECEEPVKVPAADDEEIFEEDEETFEEAPLKPKRKQVRLPGAVNKPVKKKKKQKSRDSAGEDQGLPKWVLPVAIIVGLGVGGFGAYLGIKGLSSAAQMAAADSSKVPETFSLHETKDGGFAFEYPDGWEVSSGGGTGGKPPWGKFSKGDVSFDMRADLKGAPIADIASLNNTDTEVDELSPVAKVHQFQFDVKYSLEFQDFKEEPGAAYDIPYGTGWLSEFTATEGTFKSKIHGFRLTLIGGTNQFNVICKCNEKNWVTYKPMFEKVLKSINRK